MTTPAPGCKPKANKAAKKERGTIFLGGPANLKSAEGPVTGQMRLQEAYTTWIMHGRSEFTARGAVMPSSPSIPSRS